MLLVRAASGALRAARKKPWRAVHLAVRALCESALASYPPSYHPSYMDLHYKAMTRLASDSYEIPSHKRLGVTPRELQ